MVTYFCTLTAGVTSSAVEVYEYAPQTITTTDARLNVELTITRTSYRGLRLRLATCELVIQMQLHDSRTLYGLS